MLSSILLLLVVAILSIGIEQPDQLKGTSNTIERIEGPMTLEEYYRAKDLLSVQALEENLMISPIGDL